MRQLVVLLAILAACGSDSAPNGVSCAKDTDCKLLAVTGTCESTGFCSYPDPDCTGGRYSAGAGDDLGNTCVGGASCGAKDQGCCNDTVCGPDLACVGGTCTCGGDGAPCCGGDTCSANFTCAADGTCACGGSGEACCGGSTCASGLMCDGATTCKAAAVQVGLGMGTVCVLLTDKTVQCWGADWKPYASGTPGLLSTTINSNTPQAVPNLSDVVELRSGEFHSCARHTDNTLSCWGHNDSGELGDGTKTSRFAAAKVTGLTDVTQFDTGMFHSCAVGKYNGTAGLWCWGHNGRGGRRTGSTLDANMGRLGNSDNADTTAPVAVDLSAAAAAGQTVKSLSTGGYYTCAVMSDDTVWCWGDNQAGQLGDNTTTSSKAPVKVDFSQVTIPSGVTIDRVSTSSGRRYYSSTCASLSDGTIYCWGSNQYGQLGTGASGSNVSRPGTAVISTPLATAKFTSMIAGGNDTRCARDTTNAVWCWGRGNNGTAGDNLGTTNNPTPVQAMGLANVTALAVTHHTACAVDTTGNLYCWGNNRKAQVTPRMSPAVQVDAKKLMPTRVAF